MPVTLSLHQSDILTATRNFLVSLLPAGVEVLTGQDNRVGEPSALDYVVQTIIGRVRLSTNVASYADVPGAGARLSVQAAQVTVQIDVHGPGAEDNSQLISSLAQDDFASDSFAASGFAIRPLYAGDPLQVPFVNGENQFEDRYTLDLVLQINPSISLPQDFADQVNIKLIDANGP